MMHVRSCRFLSLAIAASLALSSCAMERYHGISGLGYHATLPEARAYWRAKGYEFGPEVDTVPRMEELAALHTPSQWQHLAKRRAITRREVSAVDIDGSSASSPTVIEGGTDNSRPHTQPAPLPPPLTVTVPPPIRKPLPPLE